MTISDLHPGITASILIDGAPAIEHADTDDVEVQNVNPEIAKYQAARTVSTYIESESDKPFSIEVAVGAPYGGKKMECSKLGFHITVDGVAVSEVHCPRPFFKNKEAREAAKAVWKREIKGVEEVSKGQRQGTLRVFRFAQIDTNSETPDKAKVKRLAMQLNKVGIIEIKVYREWYGRKGGAAPGTGKGFFKTDKEIPEKALKGDAKSHAIELGKAQSIKRGEYWRTDQKDGKDYPLVIFRFLYRSNESLKQLYIIPRTPSPTPSRQGSEDPEEDVQELVNGFTAREIEDMVRQFMEKQVGSSSSSGGKRKRESGFAFGKDMKKIKKEQVESRGGGKGKKQFGRSKEKGRAGESESIDLANDSEEDEDEDDDLMIREVEEN